MTRGYTDEQAHSGVEAQFPDIETWPNQYPTEYEIEIVNPEFTSVCPKTSLPDFGKITVRYVPDERCLELKALKMYQLAYRDVGIFNENVVNRMLRDLVRACEPKRMTIIGEFTPRGGISTRVTASWSKQGGFGQP